MENLTLEEQNLANEARSWVKRNQKSIVTRFVGSIESTQFPVSVFMAGSPGAGKTEFSKRLLRNFEKNAVRIDADDIRDILPQYNGGNSYVFQGAVSLGMEKLYDFILQESLNVIMDGTLKNYEKAKNNIERSLRRGRKVDIFYVYQDPLTAWDFTKKREAVEGRNIPKDAFVESFFLARENMKKLKAHFEENIAIHVVIKNILNESEEVFYGVSNVDKCKSIPYTRDTLQKIL